MFMRATLPDTEIKRFKKWTDKLSKENKDKVRHSVKRATEMMVKGSKEKAPTNKQIGQGGRMRASIHSVYTTDHMGSAVYVGAHYAPYVEFGTRPHIIRPKNGKVLAWQTRITRGARGQLLKRSKLGPMAFATIVHHPGTKAQPFFYPTFERVKKALLKDLNKMGFK